MVKSGSTPCHCAMSLERSPKTPWLSSVINDTYFECPLRTKGGMLTCLPYYWLHSDYSETCGGGVSQKWMGSYIYN